MHTHSLITHKRHMNIFLIGGAALAAGYFAIKKGMNVNTFKQAFDYEWSVKNLRFHSITEIRFELDITVLNPSDIHIVIESPLVQVYYEGSMLTRSRYNIPKIAISANGQSKIPRIEFRIDLLRNWFTIKSMLGRLMQGVTFNNISNARQIIEKNQAAFFSLLEVQFTGRLNGTPFTKKFNLA